jgi:predicted HicB family RNase H-like nuclease
MPKEEDVLVQLATRVPRRLHREIKLFCVGNGISVMTFVGEALTSKLRKRPARRRNR